MGPTVAWFGTYDPAYARNRVLIEGLRAVGARVLEYSAPLSSSLTAARLATPGGAGELACELARAHLSLAVRHRRDVGFDALVVGYPGHLMVPFARALASRRRALLVFDPLVSLHDTFAGDRGLVAAEGLGGRVAGLADHVAFDWADMVLADTVAQGEYYRTAFGVPQRKLEVVPVGALPVPAATGAARSLRDGRPLEVLQYGKWSPLHGADVVLAAAAELRDEPFRFVLAGEGQLSARLRDDIDARGLDSVSLPGMLTASALRARVLAADVCLGVFGRSDKAGRVIPNKVYDALAAGRPLITADTPAARELLTDDRTALLVPAGAAGALAAALRRLRDGRRRARLGRAALALYRERCTPEAVGGRLLAALEARL
jgi:glycosyltransferase involved in cell wall biosynthesis